jgi:hypothetical protein
MVMSGNTLVSHACSILYLLSSGAPARPAADACRGELAIILGSSLLMLHVVVGCVRLCIITTYVARCSSSSSACAGGA